MNSTEPSLSFSPVLPHRWHALGGIWRLTFRKFLLPSHWLALGGMLLVLAVLAIPAVLDRHGAAREFVTWIINSYLLFLVPILAFISAGGALRDEMKGATVDYVFTRPVPRSWFLLCKFVSHVACAQLDFLLGFLVMLGLGIYCQAPGIFAAIPLMLLGQILIVIVFSAFGFLCGVLTSRYIVVGLAYGSVIEVGLGQIPTQLNRLSMTHQVRLMLSPLSEAVAATGSSAGITVLAVLLVSVILLAIAASVFSLLELSGPGEA